MAIFAIVAVVAVSAMIKIVGLNKQAQTLQSSMNNLGFALETMSRELRVGSRYHCETSNINNWNYTTGLGGTDLVSNTCAIGGSTAYPNGILIAFQSANTYTNADQTVCRLVYAYRFTQVSAGKWSLDKASQSLCTDSLTSASFTPVLTTTNITLSDFRFGVFNPSAKDAGAFVRLIGYAGIRDKDVNTFDVQTTISQRLPF